MRVGGPSILLAIVPALLLGACSTVEKLNPFASSDPKLKPAELAAIQPTAELKVLWKDSVGSAGGFMFSPAVVGASVYAAAQDGTIARYDGGGQVWRINAGQPISGGVGSDGRLVAVATAKGEVLAFDSAGKPKWTARVTSEVLAAPQFAEDLVRWCAAATTRIFGLDAADGKRKWVYQRSTPSLSLRSATLG
jgi:outer membrane protein assembly factor BamB